METQFRKKHGFKTHLQTHVAKQLIIKPINKHS